LILSRVAFLVFFSIFPASVWAAAVTNGGPVCGTAPDGVITDLFRHQQALRRRARLAEQGVVLDASRPAFLPDIGNVAILDDSDGAVVRPNPFDLQQRSVRFFPAAGSQYTATADVSAFDSVAAQGGTSLDGMGDDDTRLLRLPFAFPFYGQRYDTIYVNSDGNLTFTIGDVATTPRSLGRAISGPPRIFPFFQDLDPSQPDASIRYFAAPDRAVVTWNQVPQYASRGIGPRATFQVVLYSDGRIEFHYRDINITEAVVGIAPGQLRNGSTPADLSVGVPSAVSGAIAETFSAQTEMDPIAISQKFYRNHDDVYDYVVVFNNMGLSEGPGVFASERNIRNRVRGAGDFLRTNPIFDAGPEFGSSLRLQSFLVMGPLTNYPGDPKSVLPLFASSRNTALSILGQESGHRFLAYARYLDPLTNQPSRGLLGRDNAHWNYYFNTDASVVEGNRIEDLGEGQSPRFRTTATVEHYSAFDQYLMGLRGPDEVPPSFLVRNPTLGILGTSAPQAGRSFDGVRQDITVQMIVDAEGKRLPDATVAQKTFNFAFVLLVSSGAQPAAEDLVQIERLRTAWEQFFAAAVDNRGTANTSLVKQLRLSTWPAGGVLRGSAAPSTVSIAAPLTRNLDVQLSTDAGTLTAPASVTVPAGQTVAAFPITGLRQGVAELVARTTEPGYDTSRTFVQVRENAAQLRFDTVSGANQQGGRGANLSQPIVLRLRDDNDVPFAGTVVNLAVTADGTVIPARATTDASGLVQVTWRLATTGNANTLRASLDAAPAVSVDINATGIERAIFTTAGVVNAASFNTGAAAGNAALANGSLVTIFGTGLAGSTAAASGFPLPTTLASTAVTVNGVAAPLIFVSPAQINFQVPFDVSGTTAQIVVSSSAGPSAPVPVPLGVAQPGIFFDSASGLGAIIHNADGKLTSERPARAGDFLQVYATGLGAVSPAVIAGFPAPVSPLSQTVAQPQVTIGGRPAAVVFSGLAPGFAGLYQLTIQVPEGVPSGRQPAALTVNGLRSNEVLVNLQ